MRKPGPPILLNEAMNLFLFIFFIEMSEEPDGDEFLIGKARPGIITEALKTGVGTGIVDLTDEQIKLNKLIFHGKKILPSNLFVCLFNY